MFLEDYPEEECPGIVRRKYQDDGGEMKPYLQRTRRPKKTDVT